MEMCRSFSKGLSILLTLAILSGCATRPPYTGVNPVNPQFERGMPCPPLDFLGDLLSKLPQLFLWNRKYGNHQVSEATEKEVAAFLEHYKMTDVKVRINQWAPHKEIARLFTNRNIGWAYRFLYFPETLIISLIARPLSGLIVSDYFDPGSNTVHLFSNDSAIALHEAGHALDFTRPKYKGTYALARIVPGVNLFQEGIATNEAMFYLEEQKKYEELLRAYRVLYPAYATYISAYIPVVPLAYFGAIIIGHWIGRSAERDKRWQLEAEGKIPSPVLTQPSNVTTN